MAMHDIIGDIHGCATELKALLARLGYRRDDAGVHRHPERTAVFVGDLIDRGKGQLEVLQIVKAMVDEGGAKIVMGNLEFNAICFATSHPDKPGDFLRTRQDPEEKNREGHIEFLTRLSDEQQAYYIEWFKTLPLWLDLGELRVVHACWNADAMEVVRQATGGERLTDLQHYVDASTKGHPLYEAVETLLKGPEIDLKKYKQEPFYDHIGKKRTEARVRWWNADARTLGEVADVRGMKTVDGKKYPQLPDIEVHEEDLRYIYTDAVPVIYGRYWFQWDRHKEDWTDYTACVDFAALDHGGKLVAYRWDGGPTITWRNYEPHSLDVVAPTPSA